MADNYARTPFDPPDPYPDYDPTGRVRPVYITKNRWDAPEMRIPGAFGALSVEDRSGPGYPGAFLDTGTWPYRSDIGGSPYNVPEKTIPYAEPAHPDPAMLRNPLSMELGIRDIADPREILIARILKAMQGKTEDDKIKQGEGGPDLPIKKRQK